MISPNKSISSPVPVTSNRSQRRATIQNNDIDPITGLPYNKNKIKEMKLSDLDSPIKSNEPINKVVWDMLNGVTSDTPNTTSKPITARRASVMRTDIDPITGLPYKKKDTSNRKTSTVIREEVFSKENYLKGFSDVELESIVRDLTDGLVGPMPDNISDEEKLMW
eukprot:CAMPEP_0196766270 /NCGR_PEP_ID=MMETSP1095-20130614/21324_1 /TAXON_ID=96789 ORGANISM="Chromulina nebulosa, Strain UTEXLB2642" /NCGR_SAMPLE_ID=MMETSP1095 /ASSEMBLY_ACC=CAM_ASM_000446 /LENGTH=164 /DNA_ID=CAMNT_0042127241 /DNA_START=1308 /DNA_END=1799 /DNA_ORIENTATION=-